MANTFLFADNAVTTLAAPIGTSATTLTVSAGTGALFPNPEPGQQFAITLNDALTGNQYEVCYVTAVSGDTFTIVRAQEGTTAQNWVVGDHIWCGPTAGQMAGMVQTPHMMDGSIAPTFGNTTVDGTLSATGLVSFATGTFSAFNAGNYSGNPTVNFASNYAVQKNGSSIQVNVGGTIYAFDNAGNFTAPTTISTSNGNITAGNGRLRAALGARGSGDSNAAAILADFTNSQGLSGYQYLPSGLIIQWGRYTTSANPVQTVTFPIAFPQGPIVGFAAEGGAGSTNWGVGNPAIHAVSDETWTAANMQIYSLIWNGTSWVGSNGLGVFWLVIGH